MNASIHQLIVLRIDRKSIIEKNIFKHCQIRGFDIDFAQGNHSFFVFSEISLFVRKSFSIADG